MLDQLLTGVGQNPLILMGNKMHLKYMYSFFKTFKIPGLFSRVFQTLKGSSDTTFLYAAVESGLLEALRNPLFQERPD